ANSRGMTAGSPSDGGGSTRGCGCAGGAAEGNAGATVSALPRSGSGAIGPGATARDRTSGSGAGAVSIDDAEGGASAADGELATPGPAGGLASGGRSACAPASADVEALANDVRSAPGASPPAAGTTAGATTATSTGVDSSTRSAGPDRWNQGAANSTPPICPAAPGPGKTPEARAPPHT